jgi:short-subunit dehydrogenase
MNNKKHKAINEQVMVITGASSGIGLATAMAAAEAGAKLVLAARSEQTLKDIADRINAQGGTAVAVSCDVTDRAQVERVARTAVDRFGRIDTWVNNAGGAIYGRLETVSEADNRRLFDTNFWGVCNGSFEALPYLRRSGGVLVNVGSEVSEAVVPLLGMYSASKHAVKGFTDALRVELEEVEGAPVSVTLIQPTAVDTPFPQHARNYMDQEPKLPTPQIEPEQVAQAILHAAAHPTRDKKVGAMATVNTLVSKFAPGLADRMTAKQEDRQQYQEPPRNPHGALYHASETTGVVGRVRGTGGRLDDNS